MSVTGKAVVFGIRDVKPIANLPSDAIKVRIRLRAGDVGKAFVRFKYRIELWYLAPSGNMLNAETWELWQLIAVNQS